MTWYRRIIKPSIDFAVACLIVLIFWPFLITLWIVGFIVFGNALFKQTRIGRNENTFQCLKFRSFKIDGNEESIPNWGRFLRYTSLDEIPQVINILRGEMSFVGPRPLLPEYLDYYTRRQQKRHLVKPGITGLAQVNGRNALSWEDSLEFDSLYSEKISFSEDLTILFKTIPQILNFKQVNESSTVSRTAFNKQRRP